LGVCTCVYQIIQAHLCTLSVWALVHVVCALALFLRRCVRMYMGCVHMCPSKNRDTIRVSHVHPCVTCVGANMYVQMSIGKRGKAQRKRGKAQRKRGKQKHNPCVTCAHALRRVVCAFVCAFPLFLCAFPLFLCAFPLFLCAFPLFPIDI